MLLHQVTAPEDQNWGWEREDKEESVCLPFKETHSCLPVCACLVQLHKNAYM